MSSRPAAAWGEVWPPRHRRDRQWRSLARADPAGTSKPACVYENVRFAMTVGDLQGDIFIEGSALKRFPITFRRWRHCIFLNLEQGRRRETMPDGPHRNIANNSRK
jgi:hypothetical protein